MTSRLHRLARCLSVLALAMSGLLLAREAHGVEAGSIRWIRANHELNHMSVDPKSRFVAYVEGSGLGLHVLDLKTRAIHAVSDGRVGPAFFWSPDGYRLFYREHRVRGKEEVSILKAYDTVLRRSVVLDELPFLTGILTFDPRDLRLHLFGGGGIRTKRIYFPDERLAKWQVGQRTENGKFVVTQNGVLWVTQAGIAMRRLEDDGSGVESFRISPDGTTIAWATNKGKIYVSRGGAKSRFLDHGRDPSWHPDRLELVYAGARMVGDKAISYDVKLSDLKGSSRFVTSTQHSDERWPQWHPKSNQIVYTKAKSTDIFLLEFAR